MTTTLNIAAYRFVALVAPERWREGVHAAARLRDLKGTVLLAEEGINLVMAGSEINVRAFLSWLLAHPVFTGMPVKESWSETVPFGKLRVKVKREIIRMDRPSIRPQGGRAPTVDAQTLERWIDAGADDAGRPLALLDTRNAFEVDAGRFRGAVDWRIGKFGDFPAAFEAHRAELQGKTVVSYCTGGIRCEKAALLMRENGMADVLQLEGGILKYFEATTGRHFEGNCFVFDERGALSDTLVATPAM